jgi:hypothetical protein
MRPMDHDAVVFPFNGFSIYKYWWFIPFSELITADGAGFEAHLNILSNCCYSCWFNVDDLCFYKKENDSR